MFSPRYSSLEAQDGYTEPKHRHSRSEPGEERSVIGTEAQENAMTIAEGVAAWKIFTAGKGPLWRRYNANKVHKRHAQDFAKDPSKQDGLPVGHPDENRSNPKDAQCPFAELSHLGEIETPRVKSSFIYQPVSLPAPSDTQEPVADIPHDNVQDTFRDGGQETARHDIRDDANEKLDSPGPSISGSISKCPIRMLDERSPEEIARFFETHKHEIPRSHEICVRRYQSDKQTIRELDAKYGNLANMIKGLGMKHQSLLPSKEVDEEDEGIMDTNSMRKVESWAHNVDAVPQGANMPNDSKVQHLSASDDRQGYFDRPLKEIRVGESPSRPWGISVPAAAQPLNPGENASTPTPKGGGTPIKASDADLDYRARIATDVSHKIDLPGDEGPRMLFTGPVFIGYGPEQASILIRESELRKQGR